MLGGAQIKNKNDYVKVKKKIKIPHQRKQKRVNQRNTIERHNDSDSFITNSHSLHYVPLKCPFLLSKQVA
jgi:hypothetical protein